MKKTFLLIAIIFSLIFMPRVNADADEAKVNVGGGSYSFANAIEQVKNTGGTIELQKDVVLGSMIDLSVDNTVTIDLNGFNISCSAAATNFIIRKGEVKFTGSGKILNSFPNNKMGTLYVKGSDKLSDKNYTHLIVDKDVSVEGYNPIVVDAFSPYVPHCYGAVVDVYGDLKVLPGHGVAAAITVVASLKDIDNAPVVNIHDGVDLYNGVEAGLGMNLRGYSIINIGKATIESHTGIYATSGSINLDGTIIKATGENDYKEQYKNTGPTGAAIQIESNSSYAGNIEINIDGGNYTSEYNSAIVEYSNGATQTSVKKINISDGDFKSAEGFDTIDTSDDFKENNKEFITGGNFLSGDKKSDVSEFVKSGYREDKNGNVVKNPTNSKPSTNKDLENNKQEENTGDDTANNENNQLIAPEANLKSDVQNPNTGDKLYFYLILFIVSVSVLEVVLKKRIYKKW